MASKSFDSIADLLSFLERDIISSLYIVAEDIKKIMRDYIEEEIYKSYTPFEYQRTYELLNSLDVSEIQKVGDTYAFNIFFNPEKIHMSDAENQWNHHKSVYRYEEWHGLPINELVPWFIENGTDGSLWDRSGIYTIDYVQERLQKTEEHLKKIIKLLKSKGYIVEIL